MKKTLNGELIEMTQVEIDELTKSQKDGQAHIDKSILIGEYKGKQKEIQEIKAEILDYEETLQDKTPEGQAFAKSRIGILKTRLSERRSESDNIAGEAISKFGESIIGEF